MSGSLDDAYNNAHAALCHSVVDASRYVEDQIAEHRHLRAEKGASVVAVLVTALVELRGCPPFEETPGVPEPTPMLRGSIGGDT